MGFENLSAGSGGQPGRKISPEEASAALRFNDENYRRRNLESDRKNEDEKRRKEEADRIETERQRRAVASGDEKKIELTGKDIREAEEISGHKFETLK